VAVQKVLDPFFAEIAETKTFPVAGVDLRISVQASNPLDVAHQHVPPRVMESPVGEGFGNWFIGYNLTEVGIVLLVRPAKFGLHREDHLCSIPAARSLDELHEIASQKGDLFRQLRLSIELLCQRIGNALCLDLALEIFCSHCAYCLLLKDFAHHFDRREPALA